MVIEADAHVEWQLEPHYQDPLIDLRRPLAESMFLALVAVEGGRLLWAGWLARAATPLRRWKLWVKWTHSKSGGM
jgi:hypothetical protein